MSTLTDNVISEVYTSLIFRKTDNKLYYDNGASDIEVLDLTGLSGTDSDADGRFEFDSADTDGITALASGNLAEFKNNSVEKFSIDHSGVLKLNNQSGTPTPVRGGIYFKDDFFYLGSGE
tara:strand:- start:479 stop:838 length:360 start_codon:yes stop_codon:yes gene_type:complete